MRNLISALILPPCSLILLQIFALLLWRRRPRLAQSLTWFCMTFTLVYSTPMVSHQLISILEKENAPVHLNAPSLSDDAQAIVVLGAGRRADAREYGQETVSDLALQRLRYAVDLQHSTGKPILLSGGNPGSQGASEAKIMDETLRSSFGIHAEWLEETSVNTGENAQFSQKILDRAGIHKIFLVTQAWHMPRARRAFEKSGLAVIAAPMGFISNDVPHQSILSWIPTAMGAEISYDFFHEVIGLGFYKFTSPQSGK